MDYSFASHKIEALFLFCVIGFVLETPKFFEAMTQNTLLHKETAHEQAKSHHKMILHQAVEPFKDKEHMEGP